MSLTALILIIAAAFAHATWNLLAKRAAHSRHLIWFSSVGESFIFLPLVIWSMKTSAAPLNSRAAVFLLATGVLHVAYTECLQRGYRSGDLSVVYPMARGNGPLLSFVGAIIFLHEHPSALAICGALLVVAGVFLLSGAANFMGNNPEGSTSSAVTSSAVTSSEITPSSVMPAAVTPALAWGAATGLIIASYTLTDSFSVKVLLLSPVLVDYAGNLFRTVVLSPRTFRLRSSLLSELRLYWKEALGISVLTPTGYILVLYALKLAPVTHVAPARELSMMVGTLFGIKLLKEPAGMRRILASALIISGVVSLAF